jgi:ankyrin repeat protein
MSGKQLLAAVMNGNSVTVRTLLCTPGAESFIDYQDVQGDIPLHLAIELGHESIMSQLLFAGCNVDLQKKGPFSAWHGVSPLHVAARHGHTSLTEQLITASCKVDLQMKNGATPLHIAAQYGQVKVVENLISARCNINLQTQDGSTALHFNHGTAGVPLQPRYCRGPNKAQQGHGAPLQPRYCRGVAPPWLKWSAMFA